MSYISEWEADKQKNHETGADLQGNQNNFTLYKLINQESISGFPFLAINETQKRCISFTTNFIAIEDVYWHTKQYLNCDYKRCKETFFFNLSGLNEFVSQAFLETDYFVSVSYNIQNTIKNLLLTFNTDDKYYEMEYKFHKSNLVKETNNEHQIFAQVIKANSSDEDFVIFQNLNEKLEPLFAQNGLLHN